MAQRLRVHLALGKAADDLGDYALAMQHFDVADAVRRGSGSFDSAAFDTQINRLIARCTPELIARAPELGSGDATPVLIWASRLGECTLERRGKPAWHCDRQRRASSAWSKRFMR